MYCNSGTKLTYSKVNASANRNLEDVLYEYFLQMQYNHLPPFIVEE